MKFVTKAIFLIFSSILILSQTSISLVEGQQTEQDLESSMKNQTGEIIYFIVGLVVFLGIVMVLAMYVTSGKNYACADSYWKDRNDDASYTHSSS